MDNRTIKVRIKDTDEIVEVRKVGADTYLDEINKEVYNSDDFEPVTDNYSNVSSPDMFFNNIKEITEMFDKKKNEEHQKLIDAYKMALTLETVKKRPFMSPKRVQKRVNEILKKILKKDTL